MILGVHDRGVITYWSLSCSTATPMNSQEDGLDFNVEYRLARIALAPAAVEDCRCALRWVIRHAKEYNFDSSKIVVTSDSAGGYLALTTSMLPGSAGLALDRRTAGRPARHWRRGR